MTGIGHNTDVSGISRDQLRAFVERIERLGEEGNSVTVRIPTRLHEAIKVRAKKDRTTKSRKIVALLADAIGPTEEPGSVFE